MNPQTRKKSAAIVLSVLSLLIVAGCTRGHNRSPVDAILAFDVSCPAKGRMLQYAKAVYSVQRRMPAGSRLRIYVFGHGSDLTYVGDRVAGRDEFNRRIGSALANPPAHLLAPGTQTDRLLENITKDVLASHCAIVLIATDGGMEDQGAEAMVRIRHAVQNLAKAPGLKGITLIGVTPQFREQWESWLRPLSAKATVRGERDAEDGIAGLLARGGSR